MKQFRLSYPCNLYATVGGADVADARKNFAAFLDIRAENGLTLVCGNHTVSDLIVYPVWLPELIGKTDPKKYELEDCYGEAGITAEAHSDDHIFEADFDATPWFKQATQEEIKELAECDWGGDKPADEVARFCSDHNEELSRMFTYLGLIADRPSKKDECGFECYVDEGSALQWLREYRPEIYAVLEVDS